jgi:steroid 5-alpha reductase family enzyme
MTVNVWSVGFVVAIILFQLVSVPALLLKKNDLADVLWGPAFILTALAAAIWGVPDGLSSLSDRATAILILLTAWAVRLFIHVGWRNLSHKTEDVRYNNWRKAWGRNWLWRSYLQVFVLQPLILYLFLTPVLLTIAEARSTNLSWISGLGLIVAVSGFLFEAIADEQLRRFKRNSENKGKLMTEGLWSWSRHPNYFGEVLQWWGIWIMVIDLPLGWATVVSPIGVTYLILRVSGVSMLEDLMKFRPGFSEYARRTSIFIPLPPGLFKLNWPT